MKKLIVMSLFAISTAGLYGDYYGNPGNQGNFRQPQRQGNLGNQAGGPRQCCPGNFARQSSMPYTTIVNEDEQGPRQQYYYYGSDRNQNDEDYDNDDEDDNSLFQRGSNNSMNNGRDIRGNLREARNNLQGTYFNRDAARNGSASDTFRTDTDRALGQRIRDAIKSGWFSKGYEQVSLDVNNGIVTIRGFVATLNDKKNVENTIKDVNGVNDVKNQLTVQANGANQQGTMNNNNPSLMNQNRNSSANVNANTSQWYQRNTNTDNDDDEDYDNDDDDNDYPQDRASSENDRQLNQKIRDAISNGWFAKKYETVVLRTNQGVVTVEGFVESFDDQRKLNDEIRKISGVRSVNNNVQVKDKNS